MESNKPAILWIFRTSRDETTKVYGITEMIKSFLFRYPLGQALSKIAPGKI
jgi:hypothetical protein